MCFYHNDYLTSIKIKGSSRIYVYISLYFSMQRQIQPLARLRKDCVHYYARDKTLIKWLGDDINVAQPNKKDILVKHQDTALLTIFIHIYRLAVP